MAITIWGVDPSITEAKWSLLHHISTRGGWQENVSTSGGGLEVVAGTGRQVSVADGDCTAAGVLGQSSSAVTLTHDANATGINRIDYVVFRMLWSGTNTTGGTIVIVKGSTTTAVAPALARTPGTLWEVPLARVTITPSATLAIVEDCRAQPRGVKSNSSGIAAVSIRPANTGTQLARLIMGDPGWPYRVQVNATVAFSQIAEVGLMRCDVTLNGAAFASGSSGISNSAHAHVNDVSDVLTGRTVVVLSAAPVGINNETVTTLSGNPANHLTVAHLPSV